MKSQGLYLGNCLSLSLSIHTLPLFWFEELCRTGAFDGENQCLHKSNPNALGSLGEIRGDYIHF